MTRREGVEAAVDALLAEADTTQGVEGARTARRAAALASGHDDTRALRAFQVAARLDPLDAFSRLALSRLHAEAGDLDAARADAAQVLKTSVDEAARARAAFMLGEIGRAQGRILDAHDAYATAARIEDALLTADRTNVTAARWYARAVGRIAELDASNDPIEARQGAEGALALLKALTAQVGEPPALAADIADAEFRLAVFDMDSGVPTAARRRLEEAIGRYEALAVAEPAEPHWRGVLAEAQVLRAEAAFACGAKDDARAAMNKALALRVKLATVDPAERWALAGLWRVRAALLDALGEDTEAADCLLHAAALAKQIIAETDNEAATRFLVHTLIEQADLALRQNQIEHARDCAAEARERAEPFAQRDDAEWRSDLSAAWLRLGQVALTANALAQAQDAFARAVELRRQLREADPENDTLKRALASALSKTGEAALATHAHESARVAFSECFQLRLELAEAAPGAMAPAQELAVTLERLGLAAAADGDAPSARAVWEEELSLVDRIYEDPNDIEGQRMRAVIEGHLASIGGVDAAQYRASALARLDAFAQDGVLTERDKQLRLQLWRS